LEKISLLIFIAVFVEAIIDWIKDFTKAEVKWQKIIALAVSILLCLSISADLFNLLGYSLNWPYIGPVLTGIVLSRGANWFQDFFDAITAWKRD